MFAPMSPDANRGERWLAVQNDSGETIPAFALLRVTGGGKTGPTTVEQPDTDGGYSWVAGAEPTPEDFAGAATAGSGPTWAAYDPADGTPAVGETWGAGAGSWLLRKGNDGFLIVGDPDEDLEIVPVARTGAAATGGGGGFTPTAADVRLATGMPLALVGGQDILSITLPATGLYFIYARATIIARASALVLTGIDITMRIASGPTLGSDIGGTDSYIHYITQTGVYHIHTGHVGVHYNGSAGEVVRLQATLAIFNGTLDFFQAQAGPPGATSLGYVRLS